MSDEYIEKCLTYIRDKAEEYSKAVATHDHLKEFRKSKKAILMQQAEREGVKTSASQEREAYAHPEYIELLDGLKVATEQKEYLRYMLKAAELKLDVWRSQEATRRKEHTRYGN
jgi:hypothetical protein